MQWWKGVANNLLKREGDGGSPLKKMCIRDREVVEKAKQNMAISGKKTILFVDEIHRFNKGQQDYLLPFVEDGTVILIGATTENPYFEVNTALISRSIIFELQPLSEDNIKTLIYRAIEDKENGMGIYNATIDDDAVEFLAGLSNGCLLYTSRCV